MCLGSYSLMRFKLYWISRTTYVDVNTVHRCHRLDGIISRQYCLHHNPRHGPTKMEAARQHTFTILKSMLESGKKWSLNSMQTVTSKVNFWWIRYEEYVGLNEVRDAQLKVTEAEQAFMLARSTVHEAHRSFEALQLRLKEVRDRLDRISREEVHYLELATSEHKLLQEERRLRTAYEIAEGQERDKFALFSACVRESHEKERSRAERTKNWSIIGSIIGAVIGVLGSTYINRVRLVELKNLLQDAQRGPATLKEVIHDQAILNKSLEEELHTLISDLKAMLSNLPETQITSPAQTQHIASPGSLDPSSFEMGLQKLLLQSRKSHALLEEVKAALEQQGKDEGKVAADLIEFQNVVEMLSPPAGVVKPGFQTNEQILGLDAKSDNLDLEQVQKALTLQINRASLYSTALTFTAFALTVPALYFIFRGI